MEQAFVPMPGSGGTSNLSMSHFVGAGLTSRSRLRHHRPKGRHANPTACQAQTFPALVFQVLRQEIANLLDRLFCRVGIISEPMSEAHSARMHRGAIKVMKRVRKADQSDRGYT